MELWKSWLTRRLVRSESGQALVGFAVMLTAMMGMLALVVDLGLSIYGQRRFDQNGADAAALAAGKLLAADVSPLGTGGAVYFGVPDTLVYQEVRRLAGLSHTNLGSAAPTGVNQNIGLAGRNLLTVTLEYKGTAEYPTQWCYSPNGPRPVRDPAVPPCVLYEGSLAPRPALGQFFRVRVTVSSTVNGFFSHVIGTGDTTPAPPTTDDAPACMRPMRRSGGAWVPVTGVVGNTTCAHAVVVVRGSSEPLITGKLIPVGTGVCQLTVDDPTVPLLQLWGSNPSGCGSNIGDWKNMIDLTAAHRWCDDPSGGSQSNPDYKYRRLLPRHVNYTGPNCRFEQGGDTWNRGNPSDSSANYIPDPTRTGDDDPARDVPFWVARGFGGTVKAGARMPTYVNVNPASGANLGQNVALGFYCDNTVPVSGIGCPGNSPAGTYFFDKAHADFKNICPDKFQSFGVGCRDAGVILWDQPQWATGLNNGGSGWASSGAGGPDRIRVAQILNFRMYCDHATASNPNTPCNSPPKSVPGIGSATNSTVWGRFVSPFVGGPCPTCNTGPSVNGNTASLES
jgi:hypothetical protein